MNLLQKVYAVEMLLESAGETRRLISLADFISSLVAAIAAILSTILAHQAMRRSQENAARIERNTKYLAHLDTESKDIKNSMSRVIRASNFVRDLLYGNKSAEETELIKDLKNGENQKYPE